MELYLSPAVEQAVSGQIHQVQESGSLDASTVLLLGLDGEKLLTVDDFPSPPLWFSSGARPDR